MYKYIIRTTSIIAAYVLGIYFAFSFINMQCRLDALERAPAIRIEIPGFRNPGFSKPEADTRSNYEQLNYERVI